MAKRRETMSEGKKNIISALLEEYDIKSAEDIQDALKDLLGGTIQSMMEAEMDQHLGYEPYERSDNSNARNGRKSKNVRSKYGKLSINVPQDRYSTFEPEIVKKRQKDISGIDEKIIAMYAKGLTTRQISDQIEDIYGFEVSESFVSDVTDKILQDIDDWQRRPLGEIYPIVFIDTVHFSVREENMVKKLAADVRKVIYTTNAIESLNSTYRRLNSQRSVFPNDKALMKSLYLATLQATKKWSQPLRNWGKVYGEFSIMYEGRMPL
ncbi:transposase [Clostridium sp. WILCCON 0269]|uniref:Mutator family transposase n=1 Tax=Candidatus Clostridium eludens TaxID=3381663 RepID=A0ABW8SSG9_9CLOT